MVRLDLVFLYFLPNTEANIPSSRSNKGIFKFCSAGVPGRERVKELETRRWVRSAWREIHIRLSGVKHVPQSHDRRTLIPFVVRMGVATGGVQKRQRVLANVRADPQELRPFNFAKPAKPKK
jgi:hypothetical protein